MRNIKLLLVTFFSLLITCVSNPASAESICKPSNSSTPYCKYVGKITQLYINKDGLVLAFIKDPISKEQASKHGYDIKSGNAFSLQLGQSSSLIQEKIYDSLLVAYREQKEVEIHARSINKGYMELDRIWLKQNSLF